MATVSEQFDAAVKVVQCMPKDGPFQPSYEMKKRFYGLYKQATQGPCNEPKPAFWEAIRRTKWEAWSKLGNMPRDEAMSNYVNDLLKAMMKNKERDPAEIQHIVETMPITEEVSAFLKTMGPFFEAVNEPLPVPDEERWRFYDKVPAKDGSHKENGPINGDVHPEDTRGDVNGVSPPSAALPNHTGQADGMNSVLATSTPHKGHNNIGPNGDAYQNQSHPFVSDVSGNFSADSTRDLSSAVGADRSSGTSADVTVSSESDTESEDFCDSMDQPDLDQLPALVRPSDVEEPLQSITEGEVLITSTPQGKKVLTQAEVHEFKGHHLENGHSSPSDNPDGMENGDMPVSRRRGGGEVVPGGRGQGGRGQETSPGDQRGSAGSGRGHGQDTPGRDRAPFGGQGGAPGGRDPTGRQGRAPSVDVSEQIVVALQRLQCDMSSVLARLNTLEALALSQAQQTQSERRSPSEPRIQETRPPASRSWLSWIFPRSLPGRTVFFLLLWPLIVNIVVAMWRRRRHRHFRR